MKSVIGEAGNPGSYKIGISTGFKEYYKIKYDTFEVNGERPFKDIDWS